MKSLQTIQKTFRVFQILAQIAKIFCIVGASICAVGALCVVAWDNGGQVFGIFGESIKFIPDGVSMKQVYAQLLAETVMLTADAILFTFAGSYLKAEQADGTPFTKSGSEQLKKLGIRCIYIPLIAVVITAVIGVVLGVSDMEDISNFPDLITGIVLILASMIFRYGAELEEKNAQTEKD